MYHSRFLVLSIAIAALGGNIPCGAAAGEMSALTQSDVSNWLRWDELPSYPSTSSVGAFVGTSENVLIVAGGASDVGFNIRDLPLNLSDAIYALVPHVRGYRWVKIGELDSPVAQGAAISTSNGIVCLGGYKNKVCSAEVMLLRWVNSKKQLRRESLPSLPHGVRFPSATILGSVLYVAGGVDDEGKLSSNFWSLDLRNPVAWRSAASWDGSPRFGASLIVQSNGEKSRLFLLGGQSAGSILADAHCYDPQANEWRVVCSMPRPTTAAAAGALGPSHIVLIGGRTTEDQSRPAGLKSDRESNSCAFLYNTITNRWSETTAPPHSIACTNAVEFAGGLVTVGGVVNSSESTQSTYRVSMALKTRQLALVDFIVMAIYLSLVVGVGICCAGGGKTSEDYFLAGRKIPWWAAGISLMATQISPIGFMAAPAKSYATNWRYLAGAITWLIVVPVVVTCFIPFYRQLKARTAYEYLEHRFGRSVCVYAAVVYSLGQLARLAIIVYLPSLALASTTNLDMGWCIVTMGAIAIIFTILGGMGAVVWADVVQASLLIGGAVTVLVWVAVHANGGPLAAFHTAFVNDKFHIAKLDWGISDTVLWVMLVGTSFARLSELTSDQAVVQRYQSTPTQRDASLALWLNAAMSVPWALLVFSIGTAIFVFYYDHPQLLSPEIPSDGIFAFFVAQQLPPGIRGLIIAAIFFEATSSLVTAMHSTANVWSNDIYGRWISNVSDVVLLRLAKALVAVLGCFAVIAAFWMSRAGILSLWDFFLGITGPLIGSVCGLFLLGIFTNRANSAGALLGAVGSNVLTWVVATCTPIHFLLYAPLSVLSCTFLGYAVSLLFPKAANIRGLTFRTLNREL